MGKLKIFQVSGTAEDCVREFNHFMAVTDEEYKDKRIEVTVKEESE